MAFVWCCIVASKEGPVLPPGLRGFQGSIGISCVAADGKLLAPKLGATWENERHSNEPGLNLAIVLICGSICFSMLQ